MKKLIIIFLSVAMLFSALPFSALAAGNGELSRDEGASEEPSNVEEYDYKINPICGDTWKEYDYYYYYPVYSPSREEGYVTYEAFVHVTDEYSPEDIVNDDSCFPEIRDRIKSMGPIGSDRLYIELNEEFETGEDIVYTEEHIDEYISILRYICSLSFVKEVSPGRMIVFYPTPVEPGTTETDSAGPETTEPNTIEPDTATSDMTEPESTDAVTTDVETETIGSMTDAGDNNETRLNNHQTGDMFFVYLSVLLLSTGMVLVITAVIMKKKIKK